MALWASDSPDPAAVLVVCDGVTTAPHSDRASLLASTDSVPPHDPGRQRVGHRSPRRSTRPPTPSSPDAASPRWRCSE